MIHRATRVASGLFALVLVCVPPPASEAQERAPGGIVVEPAKAWTDLFDRTKGWTGADGIYSIPLSGQETPGASTPTLFVFSDTFIGEVGRDGLRKPGSTLVNNTVGLLSPSQPAPANIHFFWGKEADGAPRALFLPATPDTQPGDWYWLADGLSRDNKVHLFAMRMQLGDGGVFNFKVAGVARITLPLDSPHPVQDQVQVDAPLYFKSPDEAYEYLFGGAIMPNTQEAGAPAPDGYIYVYGSRSDVASGKKEAIVARVPPADFESFGAWRYWNGTLWVPDIAEVAPLPGTSWLSSEFSVTPLPDGRYALVYQKFGIGQETAVRVGQSPTGPFGAAVTLWVCPEADVDPDIYCYNAKAHPHLSAPGDLLISYNVNTFDFADHVYADIYRPRFIRLRLSGIAAP
jgi:uncharacterized protein DUF4185